MPKKMTETLIKYKYNIISLIWVVIISALTTNKYAPEFLNADVIINSIMSLQKVTLYYWGQNRLLNVLPFIFSGITEPSVNLFLVLFFTSLCFYLLLYYFSRIATEVMGTVKNDEVSLKVFIIVSSLYLFIFKPFAISEISLAHIEYSLPALLLSFASFNMLRNQKGRNKILLFIVSVLMIFIATGLNPSTLIPLMFVSIGSIAFRKKIGFGALSLGTTAVVSFLIWNAVLKKHGDLPYNEFRIEILFTGLEKVFSGLFSVINLPILLIVILFISTFKIVNLIYFKKLNNNDNYDLYSFCSNALVIFSLTWMLIFSASRWVEMNLFVWRYFIFAILAILFLISIYLLSFVEKLGNVKSWIFSGVVFASVCMLLTSPIKTFSEYKIFHSVNSLTDPGGHLYAGDYWVVWPSVLRDMMQGHEAYGLTFRGDANKATATEYVQKKINQNGSVSVFCLNDKAENCINQVNSIVGPTRSIRTTQTRDNVNLIEFTSPNKVE